MRIVRSSSYDEYVPWYLMRELRTGSDVFDPAILKSVELRHERMKNKHCGKVRDWFEKAYWYIVELEKVEELYNLVCLGGDRAWTHKWGLLNDSSTKNFRILKILVENAKKTEYFNLKKSEIEDKEYEKRQKYLRKFRQKWPELRGDDRIVLCSLDKGEKCENPDGDYYLHDGLGRLLTYLYMISYESKIYSPVEAFFAKNRYIVF